MSTQQPVEQADVKQSPVPAERDTGTKIFLWLLFAVASFYAAVLLYHSANPVEQSVADGSFLENCRQICLKYGLVSSGNLRKDAETYIRVAQRERLTETLSQILNSSFAAVPSQQHPLLNQPAPAFSLPDDRQQLASLQQLGLRRPMVVVFYLGYGCSHCVAQLLALDKDLHYFSELDADIVAISSDSPEHTAERYREYGEFHFPVLADVDYGVSQKWGVYQPETDEKPEFMYHGTFIVDSHGKVV